MQQQITNIVFTKNRPMQLHGYLEGLGRVLPAELIRTVILYKPELFDSEYAYCFSRFPGCEIVRETDFHSDLLGIIDNLLTPYVLFGIDDVIYFDRVDFSLIEQAFETLGADLLGFSLRLDKRQMPEDIEAGNMFDHSLDGRAIYAVDWRHGRTRNTRYPFELCATIYRADDVRRMVAGTMKGSDFLHAWFSPSSALTQLTGCVYPRRKLLKKLGYFFNPNTFESWCCRYVQHNPEIFGRLLAFRKICASAIQVNIVNTSTDNEWDNQRGLTVEALNEKYRQGVRIDIDAVMNDKPTATHSLFEKLKFSKSETQD